MLSRSLCLVVALAVCLVAMSGCDRQRQARFAEGAQLSNGGNAQAGMADIRKYGCGGCHTISGVQGANGLVGPPLDRFAYRAYIAGRLPNTPDNLMHWIQDPQQVVPQNVMPNMGVTEQDSRDIAAYLYSLR
jgi:cytochrome c1